MKKLIAMLVGAAVLYFAINGVLAVIQETSQRSNQEAYATLEAAIGAKREALSALNTQLDAVTQHINGLQIQIDDLGNQIAAIENKYKAIETQYKNGDMPNDEVSRHNALVDQHNGLVDQHIALVTEVNADLHKSKELATQIRASVDAYNHNIESANALAKQGMKRSLLIPGVVRQP